jgi:hypothetical protein
MTSPAPLGIANAKPINPNLFMLCPNPVARTLKDENPLNPQRANFRS